MEEPRNLFQEDLNHFLEVVPRKTGHVEQALLRDNVVVEDSQLSLRVLRPI